MLLQDWFILMGVGGFFILLGLGAIIWGKREEKSYYDSLSARPDMREFLERQPKWPQPEALKTGGWIAVALGLSLLVMGGVFFFWA